MSLHGPRGLGEPRIYVAEDQPEGFEAVVFVFDDTPYSMVWVIEQTPDVPDDAERLEGWQAGIDNANPPLVLEIVTIREGTSALLRTFPDPSAIPNLLNWVEDGVEFLVTGPKLTGSQAVDVANGL